MNNSKNTFLKFSRSIALVALICAITLSTTVVYAQTTDVKITKGVTKAKVIEPKVEKKAVEVKEKVESIVREGKINLKKIDKNKDGKVYQCEMDKNVISDAPANCPICGMKLKEVTLKEAKLNLKDYKPKTKKM